MRGPSDHLSRSVAPVAAADVDRRGAAPVIASKPVANTMRRARTRRPLVRRPSGVISSIGVVADVDQRHVRAVEGLVVVGVDAEPLAADDRASARAARRRSGSLDDRRGSCRARTRRRLVGVGSKSRSGRRRGSRRPPCCQRASYSPRARRRSACSAESSLPRVERAEAGDRLRVGAAEAGVVGLDRASRSSGSSGALWAGHGVVRRALEHDELRRPARR